MLLPADSPDTSISENMKDQEDGKRVVSRGCASRKRARVDSEGSSGIYETRMELKAALERLKACLERTKAVHEKQKFRFEEVKALREEQMKRLEEWKVEVVQLNQRNLWRLVYLGADQDDAATELLSAERDLGRLTSSSGEPSSGISSSRLIEDTTSRVEDARKSKSVAEKALADLDEKETQAVAMLERVNRRIEDNSRQLQVLCRNMESNTRGLESVCRQLEATEMKLITRAYLE